jgi:ATP-dependent DNA helicase RecG
MSDDFNLPDLLRRLESAHLAQVPMQAEPEILPRTVCAFLNSGGGTALVEVGLDPESAERRTRHIEQELTRRISPLALWSATMAQTGHRHYCIVDVPAGPDRPYTVDGTIYVRRGSKTRPAEREEIRGLVENSFAGSERWERRLVPGAEIDRLDTGLVIETAQQGRRRRNFPFSDPTSVPAILSDLALYREGALTQAAEVLFGRRPALQFPQIRARVTVYASDKGGSFVDSRQFEAAALPMLEHVLAMIRQHTPIAASFTAGLHRSDTPAYPEPAVREGLVNAFVHRDYANYSGGVSVDLYPRRLVIWNSGPLPEGIRISDLKREHPSMPRNPDMAQVFLLHGLMERVGRGTQKVLDSCKEAGLPAPEWKSDAAGVTLSFSASIKAAASRLNLRERKLLNEMNPGELIRLPEYAERLTVSERQARRDLGSLMDSGWLERIGEGPATVFRRTGKGWNPESA